MSCADDPSNEEILVSRATYLHYSLAESAQLIPIMTLRRGYRKMETIRVP